jgi:hypothetical protein
VRPESLRRPSIRPARRVLQGLDAVEDEKGALLPDQTSETGAAVVQRAGLGIGVAEEAEGVVDERLGGGVLVFASLAVERPVEHPRSSAPAVGRHAVQPAGDQRRFADASEGDQGEDVDFRVLPGGVQTGELRLSADEMRGMGRRPRSRKVSGAPSVPRVETLGWWPLSLRDGSTSREGDGGLRRSRISRARAVRSFSTWTLRLSAKARPSFGRHWISFSQPTACHGQGRTMSGMIRRPSCARRWRRRGTSVPRMKSEVRKSAEMRSTATRACSMAAAISARQPSPAAIFRSSQRI